MALSDILNKGACGLSEQKGYNTSKGCEIPFKDITEIWRTPWDFEFDGSLDFDKQAIVDAQKDGKLSVLKGIQSFEAQNTENQFSTNSRGFKQLAIDGIYEYKVMFDEDIWYNKQLGALEGKRNSRFFLVSEGTIFGTEGKTEGGVRGFSAHSVVRSLQTFTQGTENSSQSLEIQFASKKEIDDKPVLLAEDVISFSVDEIEPIAETYIYFDATPINGSNDLRVSVVLDRGRKDAVLGLASVTDAFTVLLNGLPETLTGLESFAKGSSIYTLTLTNTLATDDVVKVSLNGIVEIPGDCLYKSNEITTTVIV